MKRIFKFFLVMLLPLLFLSSASLAFADRGMIPIKINGEELRSIDTEIAELLGDSAWLTAVKYEGDLEDLENDLKLYSGRSAPELAFDSLDGSCTAGEEPTAFISLRGNEVFFAGSVIAPTPCYELEAELVIPTTFIYPQTIIVDITAQQDPGTICIQCIGEIPFRGEIRHLEPGEYDISICYQGNAIAQQRIKVEPQGSFLIPDYILKVLLEQEIQSLELRVVDGRAAFAVEGIVKAKLFGLFPINMRINTTVDAQSGEIVQEEMPWWAVFCGLPQRDMSQ
ncbi:MAG: hypothetical protein IBX36_03190 [Dehalococcoidia bacterium]|nr:hypothetical protein [Dehalococcoidia bacterium]